MDTLPDMRSLVDPILGKPYEEYDCWQLTRYLLKAGFGLDLVTDPASAVREVREVWFRGSGDPREVLQPWDLCILASRGLISNHLGLALDQDTMVHTRQRCGVCVEELRRWYPKFVQIGRLRMLM